MQSEKCFRGGDEARERSDVWGPLDDIPLFLPHNLKSYLHGTYGEFLICTMAFILPVGMVQSRDATVLIAPG